MPPIKSGFAPKCRVLTSDETPESFENWKETLLFNLTLDSTFEFLLEDGLKWQPISVENRGLTADSGEHGKTAKQKAAILSMLLGTIASYAPVISRQFITEEALSLSDIWSRLRIRFGFRKSGGLILDLSTLHLEEGESYEGLWERLHAFTMDNLLRPNDGLKHLNVDNPSREVLSPTLLNVTVVLWLRAINPALPALIKQRYSTELRSKTLATIREDISESLNSLIAELNGETAASIARTAPFNNYRNNRPTRSTYRPNFTNTNPNNNKSCPLCIAANRPNTNHFLSECPDLPDSDRRYMSSRARTRAIGVDEESMPNESMHDPNMRQITSSRSGDLVIPDVRKVTVKNSPYIYVKYLSHSMKLTIDSGAEANVMKLAHAERIGATIHKASTGARQADGVSGMDIVGEVHLTFKLQDLELFFDGLVAKTLSDDVIAGVPFMFANDCYARPSKRLVYFGDREFKCDINNKAATAEIVRIQRQTVLLPGDSISIPVPPAFADENMVAIEPRLESQSFLNTKLKDCWLQPQIIETEEGQISLHNNTHSPVILSRHEQIAILRPVTDYSEEPLHKVPSVPPQVQPQSSLDYKDVITDPDKILSDDLRKQFNNLHFKYKDVFDSRTRGKYNGFSGPLEVVVNMGPTLPPQKKGRVPMYKRDTLVELQRVCDELEGTVLLKPEEVGVVCEYINPTFLVRKKSGKMRLVTDFGSVGQYSKPQPALMPNVNSVLRHIGSYKYVITTDLSDAYFQNILSKDSMRYCGIATPFKGVRVYGRSAMGMPGSETALEELLCRVLGNQLMEGGVTKLADDIYCGGDTPGDALREWEKVLQALNQNGLKLSASKTIICPKTVCILGWIWENGTIRASPHKVSPLATIDPPSTVGRLRSYIGSYKFLSRVTRSYSELLHPLEEIIAGRDKSKKIS